MKHFQKMEQPEPKKSLVPESELEISFSRGGGPGGQNVNKLETKALARWSYLESSAFNDEQKALIGEKLKGRINKRGQICVDCQEERSQGQNRERAIQLLNELVERALDVPEERIPTKVPRSAKENRLQEKGFIKDKKEGRKKVDYE